MAVASPTSIGNQSIVATPSSFVTALATHAEILAEYSLPRLRIVIGQTCIPFTALPEESTALTRAGTHTIEHQPSTLRRRCEARRYRPVILEVVKPDTGLVAHDPLRQRLGRGGWRKTTMPRESVRPVATGKIRSSTETTVP